MSGYPCHLSWRSDIVLSLEEEKYVYFAAHMSDYLVAYNPSGVAELVIS